MTGCLRPRSAPVQRCLLSPWMDASSVFVASCLHLAIAIGRRMKDSI